MNFESARVSDLRQLLISSGEFTAEQAESIKGKAMLVFEIKKLADAGKIVLPDGGEEVHEETEVKQQQDVLDELPLEEISDEGVGVEYHTGPEAGYSIPKPYQPEWQEFVMKQFAEDEVLMINEKPYPTVNGLRRVVELIQGEIIFSGPINIFPALNEHDTGRASVIYRVDIAWRGGEVVHDITSDLPIRTFQATAEAYNENIHDDRFKKFPLTIAETRAEGRALRKALFLKTLAAEELTGSEGPEAVAAVEGFNANAKISAAQIGLITTKCVQLNIDVAKYATSLGGTLESLTKQVALQAIKQLNEFQQDVNLIPAELKG